VGAGGNKDKKGGAPTLYIFILCNKYKKKAGWGPESKKNLGAKAPSGDQGPGPPKGQRTPKGAKGPPFLYKSRGGAPTQIKGLKPRQGTWVGNLLGVPIPLSFYIYYIK